MEMVLTILGIVIICIAVAGAVFENVWKWKKKLEKNSLETVSKVSDAVTSQKDTVTLTLTDPSNPSNKITYSIPSFGYLKSEIERLDNTIKTLSNIESVLSN